MPKRSTKSDTLLERLTSLATSKSSSLKDDWLQFRTIAFTIVAIVLAIIWIFFSGSLKKVFRKKYKSVNEFKSEKDVLLHLKEASRRCRFDGDDARDDAFNGATGDAELALSALSESSDWNECHQTVRFAIQLLATLADTHRPEHCRKLVEMGAIPIVLECMKRLPLVDEVALCGCAVIASLTDSDRTDSGDEQMDDDRDKLVAEGVLDVLKNVLQNYSSSDWTVLMACDAIRGLVDSASPQTINERLETRRSAILESCIMEDIAGAVLEHKDNVSVAAQSLVTFAVIADCKGDNGDVQSGSEDMLLKRRDALLTSGAASSIADSLLMHRKSEKVRLYGGELLSFLCNGTDYQRNELIKGGITEALLAAQRSEVELQVLNEERAKIRAEKVALKKAEKDGLLKTTQETIHFQLETSKGPDGGTPGGRKEGEVKEGSSNAANDLTGFPSSSSKQQKEQGRFDIALNRLGSSDKRFAFISRLKSTLDSEGEEAIRAWIDMANQ